METFYLSRGEGRYQPTEHTAGPWTPEAQHFGPPSALLVRELESLPCDGERGLARVTVEILGPAPLTELTVAAEVVRPGRSVELLSATLSAGDRVVARAAAWRLAVTDTAEVATVPGEETTALPSVADCPVAEWPEGWHGGYLDAVEWRAARGAVLTAGPAAVWARQRVTLVDDEKPSPLQRVFTVADSGSGVSNVLDPRRWLFINTELTVHIHREPVGEWICLDAATTVGPRGHATARSTLHDIEGPVAAGTQALLVRHR
ncbi:thioesterase family protein [Saccharomonospora xinjiangensis]|uniref:thioesterase family protein n=1 Tax=Saccharomonospora xinjiangensis TaxID=75294 RepID=UPI0035108073